MSHPNKIKREIVRMMKGSIVCCASREYTYKGHKVVVEYDREEDNVKRWYTITTPEGIELNPDLDPYELDVANLWIDAGCPMTDPPTGSNGVQTSWNKNNLETFMKSDKLWYKDTFGDVQATIKGKKIIEAIKKKAQSNTIPTPPDKEPNVFCSYCKKPLGWKPGLQEYRSHTICPSCKVQVYRDELGITITEEEAKKDFPYLFQQAQNAVNMGAETNQGMASQAVTPTMQQEQQMQANFKADQDAIQGFDSIQNFKKSLSPDEKRQLLVSISRLKGSFPQLAMMARNPQTKTYLMMFLEQMSHSDASKVSNLRTIMQGLQHVSDRDIQMALAPESVPQQQIEQVQRMNPVEQR
jgi:hypothetical protein